MMNALIHSLVRLGSFYLYPILCFGISPMAAALAAGCFLSGAVVQGILLYRRKKAARFPVLCALAAGVPFVLLYLSGILDRLIDSREVYISLIHDNPLIHSNLGLYVIAFSVLAAWALLGVLAGWAGFRLVRRKKAL